MVFLKTKKSRKVGFFGFLWFLDIVVFLYKLYA